MNPWLRRDYQERIAKSGALYVHPDFPEWKLFVRPANRFNSDWATEAARLAKRKDFAALAEREKAEGYVASAKDKALTDEYHAALFIAAGLAGWEGVVDRDDKPLEFNPAQAYIVFDKFPELLAGAMAFSATPANFEPPTKDDKAAALEGN